METHPDENSNERELVNRRVQLIGQISMSLFKAQMATEELAQVDAWIDKLHYLGIKEV